MTSPTRKRGPEEGEEGEAQSASKFLITQDKPVPATNTKDVYSCKTCNKEFKSYQALGGHQGSHKFKNPNTVGVDPTPGPMLRKVYECRICQKMFDMAQALGGHLMEHRSSGMQKKAKSESSKQKPGSGSLIIFNTKLIWEEEFVGDKSRSDGSTLVTRDVLPPEPLRVQAVPLDIWPILEGDDLDLNLKVGLPGRSKQRD